MGHHSYSIWATPSLHSPIRTRLQTLITDLSGRYGSVPFEPHVTVAGSVGGGLSEDDVIVRTKELCRTIRPYVCRVAEMEGGSIYWQSVFLRMGETEEVMTANRRAAEAFGLPQGGYMPHLSLIYADFDEKTKDIVKNDVKIKYGDILIGTEFLVSSFSLFQTDGNDKSMKSWKKIGEYELEGK